MGSEDVGPQPRAPRLEDVVGLCRRLNAASARYVVIGGFAVDSEGLWGVDGRADRPYTLSRMERSSIVAIIRALNAAGVRYLIVGGLAVVAHGYLRFTADLDVVLDFTGDNVRKGLSAFKTLGYRPRAPVPIDDFADEAKRRSWIEEKNLKVFSLYSNEHRATEVDIFVEPPFDFQAAYPEALVQPVAAGVDARFVDYGRLVELKKGAGRPRDLDDLERLRTARGDAS